MNLTKNTTAKIILASAIAAFSAESISVTTKSGVTATLYGFASLNAAYEDSKSNNGNFANFVAASDITNENDGGWHLTPNLTRIGLNLSSGDDSTYLKANGKVEVDFYGGGSANNPNPRLRHGYGEVSFGKTGFSILGGQTWDVISPLVTPTLNAGVLNNSGDAGLRRAQLRLTEKIPVAGGSVDIAAAVVRTIGENQPYTSASASETGTDADIPTFQGRVGIAVPLWVKDKKVGLGVSGHYGKEEIDLDDTGDTKDIPTWSANVDLNLPITGTIAVLGEGFIGENLDTYAAGIGRGFAANANDPESVKSIEAYGGWIALQAKLIQKLAINVGSGIDKLDRDDIETVGGREQNISVFANATYNLTEAFSLGFEYLHIQTDYLTAGTQKVKEADLNRYQLSATYGF
ncbi:hypothetical protein [uncultured Fibrobacter sp.]|uniref:hypothetical protein n=1 Tax=uncultured Fibrobacter sp. TaxID=261512 RepID=UPI0025EB15B8|nr:hypothetical protein [uncultured Fibrobacter sp.]